MLGLFFNALFGADYIIGLDGVNTGIINGGWINRNWAQLYIQIAYIVAATAYAFVMSAILAFLINLVPGLHLRASDEAELLGMDDDQLGEFAYDYVEVRRDYLAWTPAQPEPIDGEQDIPQEQRHGISDHKDMLAGKYSTSSGSDTGRKHVPTVGDRHGQAAEEKMHPELHNMEKN
jgi:ammonium transporter, Amt family